MPYGIFSLYDPFDGVAGCLSSGLRRWIVLRFVPAAFARTVKSALFSIITSSYLSGLDFGILNPYFSGSLRIIADDKKYGISS